MAMKLLLGETYFIRGEVEVCPEKVEEELRGAEFLAVMALLEGIGRLLRDITRLVRKLREKDEVLWYYLINKVLRSMGWKVYGEEVTRYLFPDGLIVLTKTSCRAEIGEFILIGSKEGFSILPPPKNLRKPDMRVILAVLNELRVLGSILKKVVEHA